MATSVSDLMSMLSRYDKFPNWERAVRGTARIQAFLKGNTSNKLCITDLNHASKAIIKLAQSHYFAAELSRLQAGSSAGKFSSRLDKLDPLIDPTGFLRVGGRLKHAFSVNESLKHPIILPRGSHVAKLIIRDCHEAVAHQGKGFTVNKIRSRGFWIIGCSIMVSSLIHQCVTCRRLRGCTQGQKMADLPEEKLTPAAPFTYCGFDCFGPFMVREGRKELKRYGLLFTCMASRAVHLEVLTDMKSDTFINALRCFIALRGPVRQLRSDRGSNFIGAHNELLKALDGMEDPKMQAFLLNHRCDFVFNAPASSHMGGVWERQIRTVRNVLTGILQKASGILNTAGLRTLLYETMCIVNSRPLTVDNLSDPGSALPLTPNHLLTGKSEVIVPPPEDFEIADLCSKKQWRKVQSLANQFWSRWKKEYLHGLQPRQRWLKCQRNIAVGDIVLVQDENVVRNDWRLARVTEVMLSRDGLARTAKISIGKSDGSGHQPTTQLVRPIHKLKVLVEAPDAGVPT